MCHVLVIEDEPLIAYHVCDLATDAGATSVDIATTPQEALASALLRTPAVILSDVKIIDGTGPEAVMEIRRQIGPLPVIFITGTPEACQPCDYAAAILSKPIVPHHVVSAFQQVAPRPERFHDGRNLEKIPIERIV